MDNEIFNSYKTIFFQEVKLPQNVFRKRFKILHLFNFDILRTGIDLFFQALEQFGAKLGESQFGIINPREFKYTQVNDPVTQTSINKEVVIPAFVKTFSIGSEVDFIKANIQDERGVSFFLFDLESAIVGNSTSWGVYCDGDFDVIMFGIDELYSEAFRGIFLTPEFEPYRHEEPFEYLTALKGFFRSYRNQ